MTETEIAPIRTDFCGYPIHHPAQVRPNRIDIADGIAVEWKSDAVPAGPGGVEAEAVLLDGRMQIRITSPQNTGWIRLALTLPRPADRDLVGVQSLLRVEPLIEGANRLRPMMSVTRRRNQARAGQGPTALSVYAEAGRWSRLQGIFLCAPARDDYETDLLINLPEQAVISMTSVTAAWFEAGLPDSFAERLAEQPILPLQEWTLRPLHADPGTALTTPVVFGAMTTGTDDVISGWLLAAGDDAEVTAPWVQDPVAARQPALLPGGVRTAAGFTLPPPAAAWDGVLSPGSLGVRSPGAVTTALNDLVNQIAGSPLQSRDDRPVSDEVAAACLGRVETLNRDLVRGWIRRTDGGTDPVDIGIVVDGTMLRILRAGETLPGQPAGSGFSFALPETLRDGQAHLVEIIEIETGLLLANGRARLQTPLEGVAFIDAGRQGGGIAGWVSAGSVRVVVDGEEPGIVLTPDQHVPGLAAHNRQGFFLPVPERFRDGALHRAEVRFAGNNCLLDGAMLSFRVGRQATRAELVSVTGRRILMRLVNAAGHGVVLPVTVRIDGQQLYSTLSNESRAVPQAPGHRGAGYFSFTLPADAGEIVLEHSGAPVATEIGRFRLLPPRDADEAFHIGNTQVFSMDAEGLNNARTAFDTWLNDPQGFDAAWYLASNHLPTKGKDVALSHYRTEGLRNSLSPVATFDEGAARVAYPAVAEAIRNGDLPCAWALACLLGPDALPDALPIDPQILRGLATPAPGEGLAQALRREHEAVTARLGDTAGTTGSPAVARRATSPVLPPLSRQASSQDSIFAAWMARLRMSSAVRAELDADEAGTHKTIRTTGLTREPLVSIIMPSWNRAYTIGEAVQSVLDQTYQNWELLICDDASEDKTPEVMRQFRDPRIRYMQFVKSNGAGARNRGLRFARGEYIAFLDSDNLWNPVFLDVMLRVLMGAPGRALAYCGYLDTEMKGASVELDRVSRPGFRPVALSDRNFMDLNSIVYHRRVHDWLGGFDGDLPRLQDWDLMLRHTGVFPPVYVDHCMVFYRRNIGWGQVTHQFMGGTTRSTVLEKTRQRLEEDHARLDIRWPERRRIALVAGPTPAAALLARALAVLAARRVDVDLILPGGNGQEMAGTLPEGVHAVQVPDMALEDDGRVAYALHDRLSGIPVIGVDLARSQFQRVLPPTAAARYRLQLAADGLELYDRDAPAIRFPLGTLPLDAGFGVSGKAVAEDTLPPVLLLPEEDTKQKDPRKFQAALALVRKKTGAANSLLIPPPHFAGDQWTVVTSEGITTRRMSLEQAVPALLAGIRLVLVQAADRVSPFAFCLITSLQGAGALLAVRPGTPLADDWIGAKAAYQISRPEAGWMVEKASNLLVKTDDLQALAERGLRAHRAVHHSELVQERLDHFLYRILFDPPAVETGALKG